MCTTFISPGLNPNPTSFLSNAATSGLSVEGITKGTLSCLLSRGEEQEAAAMTAGYDGDRHWGNGPLAPVYICGSQPLLVLLLLASIEQYHLVVLGCFCYYHHGCLNEMRHQGWESGSKRAQIVWAHVPKRKPGASPNWET